MPWKDLSLMDQRDEFVRLAKNPGANIALLCRRYQICRKTAYKWIARYEEGGVEALADRSRRPRGSPNRCSPDIERHVTELRQKYPAWGPRKLHAVLQRQTQGSLPTVSTIGRILKRNGWIDSERSAQGHPLGRFERQLPNELWQMDFKGHVPMLDGQRCHPLTLVDDYSRFSLAAAACGNERMETVQNVLIPTFMQYGQPRAILCDNGPPWGSAAGGPFTELEVWLMRHGIAMLHGRPRHPQTQGKNERFNRTLKEEALRWGVLSNLRHAGERLEAFRRTYNEIRPHEALGMKAPISRYRASDWEYDPNPRPPELEKGDEKRKVGAHGGASFRNKQFKMGKAFIGQEVTLRPDAQEDGHMRILYWGQELGLLDMKTPQEDSEVIWHSWSRGHECQELDTEAIIE